MTRPPARCPAARPAFVLFPGRHHLLTRFQGDYLRRLAGCAWIVDNKLAPVASLHSLDGAPLDWPVTHVLTVARRPLNS
ncbi:MAG TPA: hypothetical protein VFM55_21225 [Micromonosporaceae bacterium]|nr:hypothetical protein [Micromonosporaceae bacterium]